MAWGDKKEGTGRKPFGVDLQRMRSNGADVENGGLPEGAMYFAGVLYGMVVEVMLKREGEPAGGWFGSGQVPPLVVELKTPFTGDVLDEMELGPIGNGVSGVGAGFGNAAGQPGEVKMCPIAGDLNNHVLWVGPNGWQARFGGGDNNRLEKLPVAQVEPPTKAA